MWPRLFAGYVYGTPRNHVILDSPRVRVIRRPTGHPRSPVAGEYRNAGHGQARMGLVTGHVFVVPGTLQHFAYDDVLISTDYSPGVGRKWWPVLGWDDETGAVENGHL